MTLESIGLMENRNLYAACSGAIEATDGSPYDAALRELKEETGLAPPDITLIRQGPRYLTQDKFLGKEWMIFPSLWRFTPSSPEAEGPEARIRELSSSLEESGFSKLLPHLQWAAERVKLESMIKLNKENTKVLVVKPEKLKDMQGLMVPNLILGISQVVKHLPQEKTPLSGNKVPPESLVRQMDDENVEKGKD